MFLCQSGSIKCSLQLELLICWSFTSILLASYYQKKYVAQKKPVKKLSQYLNFNSWRKKERTSCNNRYFQGKKNCYGTEMWCLFCYSETIDLSHLSCLVLTQSHLSCLVLTQSLFESFLTCFVNSYNIQYCKVVKSIYI